jgi:dTDP-4-dehydrorhamnose reductase
MKKTVKNILVFGKNGQLAKSLAKISNQYKEFNLTFIDSKKVDFSKPDKVIGFLRTIKEPLFAIINTSAYTQVDLAEKENDLCRLINTTTPTIIANWAKENGVIFISYSTDYVFDGKGSEPYQENNTKNLHPLGFYGLSKLEMEREISKIDGKYIIFRTSWLYSVDGVNFPNTMLRLFKEKEIIRVVDDQYGSPTNSLDAANATLEVLKKGAKTKGIYNLVNAGYTSWYSFALFILDGYKKNNFVVREIIPQIFPQIIPISSAEYPTLAKRPLNSRLDCSKIKKDYGIVLRTWQEAFDDAYR